MDARKYYVTVGGDHLIALDVETAQLLGRSRDLHDLHAYVQNLFPGIVYSPLDEERVRQYVAAQGASSPPERAASPTPVTAAIYCSHCGAENAQGVNFCWKCGTRLGASMSPPSPNQRYQEPLPVVIVQDLKTNGWFRENLPHILAAGGGLLFLFFFALPIKTYSIFGVVLRYSPSGYGLLQGGFGAFAVAIVALVASKVIQQVRGKQFHGQERFFASYATIAVLTILLVLIMYASVHLYDSDTGKRTTGIDETPSGAVYAIGGLLIVLIGGIIEISRYYRADAASPQSDGTRGDGFYFFRKKATKSGAASQAEKNPE